MKWCLACLFCLSLGVCVTTAQVQTTFTKASIRAPVKICGRIILNGYRSDL